LGGPPSIGHVHGFTSAMWHSRQTHLIANSYAVRQDLIDKGLAAERISVLHCPVDPQDQQPWRSRASVRAELGVDERTPVVGTFAHLSVKKGYRELVRAAEIVLKAKPNAQFWCVGEGVLRPELAQHAAAAGITDRFRLLGFRRDVPDLMRAIDVMCLPSHREPFGMVYVEAALAERPVIGCRAGGAPEIIEHGESGWLVSPRDVPELASAISTALENRICGAEMGRRGRQLALARFGWQGFLERLEGLYRRLLDERPQIRKAA
jgi:glycosyltransferase involved in cell wall biosynthesis